MIDIDDEEEYSRINQLASFASTIIDKRREAVDGRLNTGIEQIWRDDDEYYEGIDELNIISKWRKPSSSDGRLTAIRNSSTRSNVFVNITAPYVDMGAARVCDMMLPNDDKLFSIEPTPIPELSNDKNSTDLMPDGTQVSDAAKEMLKEAEEKSEKAETQIWDWLSESNFSGQMRRVVEQAARIGTGCLKGPVPIARKKRKVSRSDAGMTIEIHEEIAPSSKFVDIWNIFPDPSCGESIHDGSYIFERDYISAKQLRNLIGHEELGYLDSEILEALKDGAKKQQTDAKGNQILSDQYEIWYYYGTASANEIRSAKCECGDDEQMNVIVTMIDNKIIRAAMNPLPSGEFPYDIMKWKSLPGKWFGEGIARQVRTPQRMINAGTRNLLDNAGVSAGVQLIINRDVIRPMDGVWEITPLKLWESVENADINDIRSAITAINIDSRQAELQNIIMLALDFAERATSMPLILQGQQGAATETVGGMTILQNNSSSVLRRIAKTIDDTISIPHVQRYYEWLMVLGDDDSMKGDFSVIAKGSSVLFERDAQNQAIMQMLQFSGNVAFGLSPDKLMTEVLKMNRISPDRVRYSDEEIAQIKQQPQQEDPKISGAKEVATIKVQGDLQKAQLVQQSDAQELELKAQQMQSEFQLKMQLAQLEQAHQMRLKEIDYNIKMMELAQSSQISIESIKAALATDAAKINTQKELSYAGLANKETISAPTEPFGKADKGHSYEQ